RNTAYRRTARARGEPGDPLVRAAPHHRSASGGSCGASSLGLQLETPEAILVNLSQRLAARQVAPSGAPAAASTKHEAQTGAVPTRRRITDPYAEIKARVHTSLLQTLGPTLYDANMDQSELEHRVRQTL